MSLLNKKSESIFKEFPITPTQPSPTNDVFMYLWGNLGYILKEATMFTVLAAVIYQFQNTWFDCILIITRKTRWTQ